MFLEFCVVFLFQVVRLQEWGFIMIDGTIELDQELVNIGKGYGDDTTHPGGRANFCLWMNDDGKLYLFGGQNMNGYMNDLWSKSILTNENKEYTLYNWIFIDGSTDPDQIPSSNKPGSQHSMACWVFEKKLYSLGGHGFYSNGEKGLSNALWVYDTSNSDGWKLEEGSHSGLEITENNYPGSRFGLVTWNIVSCSMVYLYGGFGVCGSDTSNLEFCNDFYSYGYKNDKMEFSAMSSANGPSLRNAMGWYSDNYLYLYGGSSEDDTSKLLYSIQFHNDGGCIEDISTTWSVKSGSSSSAKGNYVNFGQYSDVSFPKARENAIFFSPENDSTLLTFSGNSNYGIMQDFWLFDISGNQWMWQLGSEASNVTLSPVVGNKGYYRSGNIPTDRYGSRVVSFIHPDENNEKFYIYGGYSREFDGYLNDLWLVMDFENEGGKCYGYSVYEEDVCSGHGSCDPNTGTCTCDEEYQDGKDCSKTTGENIDNTPFYVFLFCAIGMSVLDLVVLIAIILFGTVVIRKYVESRNENPEKWNTKKTSTKKTPSKKTPSKKTPKSKDKKNKKIKNKKNKKKKQDEDDGTNFKKFKSATDYVDEDEDEEDEEDEVSPEEDSDDGEDDEIDESESEED